MTPHCSGGNIRVRSLELFAVCAIFALIARAQDVSTLARAYAANPDLTNRAALLRYAAGHKDASGAIALLAVSAGDVRTQQHPDTIRNLQTAAPRLSQIPDYVAWLSASARFVNREFEAAAVDCEAVMKQQPRSPFFGQAALLAAKAYIDANAPARAIELLQRVYKELPQPDGDAAMAGAYDAAHDSVNALAFDQRLWLEYPATTQARDAAAEIERLKIAFGSSYHPPSASALLARATKLLEYRDSARARKEFAALATSATGAERDLALVRLGAADQQARKDALVVTYLQALHVTTPEADAERLYYLLVSARRLNRLDVMDRAVDELARWHPKSEWRLRALVAAGNEYFLLNQPEQFEPLFRTCQEQFPDAAQAQYCHWRITFSAYLQARKDTAELLRTHLRRFPDSDKASASMYFLGRLAERASNWGEARAWYDRLLRAYPNYYYAVLARARKSERAILAAAPDPATVDFLRRVSFPSRALPVSFEAQPPARVRFERAGLLRMAALDEYAEAELRFGARDSDQPEAYGLELARIASSRSAPERAIRYLKRYAPGYLLAPLESAPREFWTLAFPIPWRGALFQYSEAVGLDPYMVAALIRQESEFDPDVVSAARAYGLTQILPSTGRELGRRLRLRSFRPNKLLQPEFNIRLGTVYLRSLLDQFGGAWEPTLAAYNAGKTRVVAWRGRMEYREPAEFVEAIPFSETRNYVQVVIRNADLYRRLYERSSK
jgi:soluble lytic murein transglycosylase